MEANFRALLLTGYAPVVWGSTYLVTELWLPADRPLFSALVRALPIGLLIVAYRRRLPHGHWWWRVALLGTLNIGAFFALLFLAAYRIPGGLAATLTATSPIAVMALAWLLIRERVRLPAVLGALAGIGGVALLVLRAGVVVDPVGVVAALGAVTVSAVGFVLVKRWTPPVDLLTFAGWQLVAGGLVLAPVALVVEGAPPPLDLPAVGGYLYLGLFGTGLAYLAWFGGLRSLPAGSVALVGLVNPVVGTLLGVWFAGEAFGVTQLAGMVLVLGGVTLGQPSVLAGLLRFARPRSATTRDTPAVGGVRENPAGVDHPAAGERLSAA